MKDRIKGLWKVLFGRTTIFVVLILIQILILFGGMAVLGTKVIIANNIIGVLSVIILIYLLNVRTNNSFKLMWIIIIVATPVVGVPFFIFTRFQPDTRYIARRLNEQLTHQKNLLLPDEGTVNRLDADSGNEYGIFKYLYEEGHFPVYDDTGIEYFPLGEDKYDELVKQLQKARKFIFMEYFIVSKGEMWSQILNILRQKVNEGVEVRFMYDGTNTMVNLPKNYPQQLRKYGIQCKVFSPMRPAISTHQNNRDHRKIAVIDGHTAFTGGINLADEYINRKERFGHWKDTAIMIKGRAVDSFTMMFLQMWNVDTDINEDCSTYLYQETALDDSVTYGGYIVPFGDSPLDNEEVGKKVYLDILNRANEYVHIMTPYLILDEELLNSLIFAAQRGIDVKLILPHVPDKKYAYFLARTHYAELISQGVKIYEYTPGFVHAKNFVSDDEKAVVGTINLDFRSLYLHFECAAYIWNNPIIADIEDDFQQTLKKCQRITMKDCKNYSAIGKICGSALRLVAPLM
ncbi:MAG: cardiolipin synthase [Clostridia bacterium]|nr:cardiolipin synthase [Clostridia bacterium]